MNGSSVSIVQSPRPSLAGKDGYLNLLADVGKAVAIGAEDGEDLAEIATKDLAFKVCRVLDSTSIWSLCALSIGISESGKLVHHHFESWNVAVICP